MPHVNVEIKARCSDLDRVRDRLIALGARVVGTDHQIDTYFQVPRGRLKLRERHCVYDSLIIDTALIYPV